MEVSMSVPRPKITPIENGPLSVDPAEIADIHVLETIKEGRTIYEAPAA
jgi:predicted amidohydrolase YtcJ